MATKIRRKTSSKQVVRFKRKTRIRSRLSGTAERPRLAIFRSNRHIYVQIINDIQGHTLLAVSTLSEGQEKNGLGTIPGAKALGGLLAKKAFDQKISTVVFDRSGYLYHGQVKALADAAREAGLKF